MDFDLQSDEVAEPYAATSRGLGKPSEEYTSESVDAEPAAVAAGPVAGASDKHHSDDEIFGDSAEPADEDTNGLPMRGLVMILAAVGVLLVGWGAFTLLSGDEDGDNSAAETSQHADAEQQQDAAAAQKDAAKDKTAQDKAAKDSAAQDGEKSDQPAEDKADAKPAEPNQPAQGEAAAPAIDPAKEYIAVLNNSPIQGLASDVSNKIKEGDFKSTGFGNLPDATFPESVVVYPTDNDGARQAAEDLASQLGIRAEARTPEINRAIDNAQMLEGAAPDQIVVITTNNMPR